MRGIGLTKQSVMVQMRLTHAWHQHLNRIMDKKWNDKGWRRETSVWAAAWKESANRLTAMLGPQKPMSAEEVTEPGHYWHREGQNDINDWDIVEVGQSGHGFQKYSRS